jgi:predicted Zn-dependent protease
MGAIEDYFRANGWPKNGEDARRAKEVVEAAETLRQLREKCERACVVLAQARLLLKVNKYAEAVEKLKTLTGAGT